MPGICRIWSPSGISKPTHQLQCRLLHDQVRPHKVRIQTLVLIKEMMACKPETQPRDHPTWGYGGFGRNANLLCIPVQITTLHCPFIQAAPGPPHLRAASYALRGPHSLLTWTGQLPSQIQWWETGLGKVHQQISVLPWQQWHLYHWNIKGDCANCNHSKNEHLHICSFCGKTHSALSWTCHSWPTNAVGEGVDVLKVPI